MSNQAFLLFSEFQNKLMYIQSNYPTSPIIQKIQKKKKQRKMIGQQDIENINKLYNMIKGNGTSIYLECTQKII